MYDIINTRLPPVNTPTVDLTPQQFNKYMINMVQIQKSSELEADTEMAEEVEEQTADKLARLKTTPPYTNTTQELAVVNANIQQIQNLEKEEKEEEKEKLEPAIVGGKRKKINKRNTYKTRTRKYKNNLLKQPF